MYQSEFRKPVHVVFCLDYSGSMYGEGISELRDAMSYIFNSDDIKVKFSDADKIDVIPFSTSVIDVWSTSDGLSHYEILSKIQNASVGGATALYDAAQKGLEILASEDDSEYVNSIILMTDGQSNVGSYWNLQNAYNKLKKDIPIYSITFGSADEDELIDISTLTNGKVFDGKTDLVTAFKKVRGYN